MIILILAIMQINRDKHFQYIGTVIIIGPIKEPIKRIENFQRCCFANICFLSFA